jgi:hypothetical protein
MGKLKALSSIWASHDVGKVSSSRGFLAIELHNFFGSQPNPVAELKSAVPSRWSPEHKRLLCQEEKTIVTRFLPEALGF